MPQNTRQQNDVVGSTDRPDKTWLTENLSIYLSPPAPISPLQNPSNFGATASHWLLYFLLFFFFFIINRMDAWSLMRGNAFIHFVCGSRRVNIRLGVLLLIPKSPQSYCADPFTVFSRSHSDFHLKLLETIHILTHKPSL